MFVRLRKPGELPSELRLSPFNLPRVLVVAPSPLAIFLRLGPVASVLDEGPELAARHLILAHVEVARKLHAVPLLVSATLLLARRRSHLECACLHPHELHRDAIAKIQHQHSAQTAPRLSVLVIVECLFPVAAGWRYCANDKQ